MKPALALVGAATLLLATPAAPSPTAGPLLLVEEGQPRAGIVIAGEPLRPVRLAAQELQDGIRKISGAHLPIVTQPGAHAAHIFVGRSRHTDKLGITAAGLQHGAYRIVSGEGWLALLGEDTKFTPIEPWARNNAEIVSGKAQREWDRITGALWGLPNLLIYKDRFRVPGDTGLPASGRDPGRKLPPLEMWGFDERGSFNAVCGLLMKLGMRWYAPGELGEVVPALRTIQVPPVDEIVRPDFPVRRFNVRLGVHGPAVARWAMRLGMRDPYGVELPHGMHGMTHREEVFARHPGWFALYGGKRHTQPGQTVNQLCYSNEELFRETARFVRAQFDHYRMDVVSVMPPDAYTAICQCPLCEGQDTPQRGQRGLLSDHVWGFVNRVAREVRQTHPDKKISNCAYGTYSLPPLKIDKLEPNVVVGIVGGRRPVNNRPEEQAEVRKLREGWLPKTENPVIIFENYPFTDRGWYLPSFTPHAMGASINATKGYSDGEDIWLSMGDFENAAPAFNHFLVYFSQRMCWGGPETDVDAMFREYCRLFYGPAEREMLAFLEFCEENWQAMEKEKDKADAALALFGKAKSKADATSIYGKRLAWMDAYLKGLRSKSAQLGRKRGPVPVLRLVGDARGPVAIDGDLDEALWTQCPTASTGRLRELQTGRQPVFGTTFKAAWIGNNLYFAIRCDEHPAEQPNVGATRHDDSALWYGDCVEVLLETESRSYYQIAVSPGAAVADLDRSASRNAWFSWDSQAEVATRVADDHWTVEIRIPVTPDENDPLHQVIGRKPTASLPWHVNICRQRLRDGAVEASAFSPTGAAHFHVPLKMAHFYDGRHQVFEAEPEGDYLDKLHAAAALASAGQREQALAAYQGAAGGEITDLQRSHALELAASLARGLHNPALAGQLVDRIPIPAAQKAARMRHLLETGKAAEVITQFAAEDVGAWPFWKRGEGFFARGRAHRIAKSGGKAENDLARSLDWISDPRLRDDALLNLAQNRETNLQDDEGAVAAYRQIVSGGQALGSSTQFYAVHGIAAILSKRGRHDEALAALSRVDATRLEGFWRDQFRLWQADALLAAGRNQEARSAYQSIAGAPSADPRHRQQARVKLDAMD